MRTATPIRALARGAFTLQEAYGTLAAVYPRVANIEIGTGYYISLVLDEGNMSAFALHVDELPVVADDVGVPARLGEERLVIGTHAELEIEVAAAPLWESAVPLDGYVDPAAFLEPLRNVLAEHGRPGGFLSLVVGTESNPFADRARVILDDAYQRALRSGTLDGLEKLVGLGPGLTPSGDDFLAGLLLCCALLERGPQPLPAVDSEMLWRAIPRTTVAGRTLLRMALSGHFPAYLLHMARALGRGEAIEDAVGLAVRHGASSGSDAIAGILWGAALAAHR